MKHFEAFHRTCWPCDDCYLGMFIKDVGRLWAILDIPNLTTHVLCFLYYAYCLSPILCWNTLPTPKSEVLYERSLFLHCLFLHLKRDGQISILCIFLNYLIELLVRNENYSQICVRLFWVFANIVKIPPAVNSSWVIQNM